MDSLHELSTLIARHSGPEPLATSWNKDLRLRLITVRRTQEPSHQLYEPVFALVVQGQKEIVLGDQIFKGRARSFMVVSVDLPVTFSITEATPARPYVAMALAIPPAAVASLLTSAPVVTVIDPLSRTCLCASCTRCAVPIIQRIPIWNCASVS